MCNTHYQRVLKTGSIHLASLVPAADRFWPKVEPTGFCWNWTGSKEAGYGRFNIDRVPVPAHRFSYETLVGPIPADLHLDHLCRNRACVNPDHLEPVTNYQNMMRGFGIARRNAEVTHCPAGHEYAGENLYVNPTRGTRLCRACARATAARSRAKLRRMRQSRAAYDEDAVKELGKYSI